MSLFVQRLKTEAKSRSQLGEAQKDLLLCMIYTYYFIFKRITKKNIEHELIYFLLLQLQ
jgi:hypothetical protein